MRIAMRIVVISVLIMAAGGSLLIARRPLVAVLVVQNVDLGIPGITKAYEARLVNRGIFPVRVTRCDAMNDAFEHETMLSYDVQRWSDDRKRWVAITHANKVDFCRPYPLGIVKGNLGRKWLWPGWSLSTNLEATAARRDFGIGDRARFVVFAGDPGDYNSSLPTSAFTVDEHVETNINYRVVH